jgi:crotonobetainyl-CoA:carnitine CoA-transferase CaiB-like acyl-CoA transferase
MPASALAHLRVIDCTDLRGALAGRLLADLGADVIKVEPPGGDPGRWQPPFVGNVRAPDRALPFLYRNANKRGTVMDLHDAHGRQRFAELCEQADILFENFAAEERRMLGLDPAEVRARHPRLMHVAIADFGLSGPRAGWRAEPLVAFAASGALHASGFLDRPPCWLPGFLAHDCASVFAVIGALTGMLERERVGGGQSIEVSVQEAALHGLNPWSIPLADYARMYPLVPASPPRNADGAYLVLPTADGHVRVLPGTARQWRGFVQLLGNPEALAGEEWENPIFRLLNGDAIRLLATGALRERRRAEVFAEARRLGLPMAPVNTPDDFVQEEQTRIRGYFRRTDFPHIGGAPFAPAPLNFSATPAVLKRPAPELGKSGSADSWLRAADREERASRASAGSVEESCQGQHPVRPEESPSIGCASNGVAAENPSASRAGNTQAPPLAGMRVIDLGVGAVGPEVCWVLAELGAEVIKIESRVNLDFLRAVTVEPDMPNRAWTFNDECRGQKSVCLDLRTARGRELALQLCTAADIVVENNRGGVVGKWGLDYDDVRRVRPDAIYVASQGFGRGGPLGEAQAFGPLNSSFAGANWLWNYPDAPYPAGVSLNHPDHIASKLAAAAVLAAIAHRRRTGEGQLIEMAQTEVAAYLLGEFYLEGSCTGRSPVQRGNAAEYAVPHGVYPCAGDDRWCAIAVTSDAAWERFVGCVAWSPHPNWASLEGRLAARAEIDARVAEWTRTREPEDAAATLQAAGVSAMAVLSPDDSRADAHLAARGAIVTVQHPEIGPEHHIGNPIRMSRTRWVTAGAAPLLGADTEEVLTRVLGLASQDVERLVAEGVCR